MLATLEKGLGQIASGLLVNRRSNTSTQVTQQHHACENAPQPDQMEYMIVENAQTQQSGTENGLYRGRIKRRKPTPLPNRRSRASLERKVGLALVILLNAKLTRLLQTEVRKHIDRLAENRIQDTFSVTVAEAKRWQTQPLDNRPNPECCTAETFRVCIQGDPKSPWNRSAARVFSRSFATHHGLDPTPENLNDIYERALSRFKNIKAEIKRKALPDEDKELVAQRERRRGRKSGVREHIYIRLPAFSISYVTADISPAP